MNWFKKKVVLVPVDFSAQSMAAIDAGLDAVDSPAGLHVLHVLPMLTAAEPAGLAWDVPGDNVRLEATEKALRERLGNEKYRGIQIAARIGDPGHDIVDYAKQIKAEMIILPSHGRTGFKRLLIGSVAERVCRLAHCPVLVLRS